MKIGPVGAELFHAGGQIYEKTNGSFSQFWAKKDYKRIATTAYTKNISLPKQCTSVLLEHQRQRQ